MTREDPRQLHAPHGGFLGARSQSSCESAKRLAAPLLLLNPLMMEAFFVFPNGIPNPRSFLFLF
jgi:hypothetical protein